MRQMIKFSSTASPVRAILPWFCQSAPIGAHFFGAQVVDIGPARDDQMFGPFIKPLEIVGGVSDISIPADIQPFHISLNGIDKFLIFFGGIGVIEAQIAAPAEFRGNSEI